MDTFSELVALAAALLNGFKLLRNAHKAPGPGVGTAAKNHQNQGDDAVHGAAFGPGDGGSIQFQETHGQQLLEQGRSSSPF